MNRFQEKSVSKTESEKHLNFMAGAGYFISDPIKALRLAASSCFFGEPKYYHLDEKDKRSRRNLYETPARSSRLTLEAVKHLRETLNAIDPQDWRGKTPAEVIESAIDVALAHNPEETLKEAVRLRNEEHIRTTPQVILVRAARHEKVRGTGLVPKYAMDIMKRADEPAVGLAYHIWRFGKDAAIPNSLKKAWSKALAKANEYQLAKYRLESQAVKTVDVVNLVHPKSDAIGKLVKGELRTTDKTWESIISAEGSTQASWEKAIDVMGHMALLRNVRNLLEKGLDPGLFVDKLVEGAETGKQFPFRYFSAYKAVEGKAPGKVLDAIETCLERSLGNLPEFKGRVMSLCDNSGSAWGAATSSMGTMTVAEIANLTGVLTGKVSEDGYVGIFGDELKTFSVRKKSSVFDQLKESIKLGKNIGGGTENGIWLFWDKAIREKEHWDHIFVYSDMQAGHGGLYGVNPKQYENFAWSGSKGYIDVGKLVNEYRRKVNPNVNVYLVQVAGYTDTILPEFYNRTYILGGWGEGVLRFAAEMSKISPSQ